MVKTNPTKANDETEKVNQLGSKGIVGGGQVNAVDTITDTDK